MANIPAGASISVKVSKYGPLWSDQIIVDTRRGLRNILREISISLRNKLEEASPEGAGVVLKNNWYASPIRQLASTTAFQIYNYTPYLDPVEMGRRPAPVASKFLYPWVLKKITQDEKKAKRIAFLIARHKATHRTDGQRFVKKTFEKWAPIYEVEMGIALGAFYDRYSR